MNLKSTRFLFSMTAVLLIVGLAVYIPNGNATTTAISTIGIVVGVYVGGQSAVHTVREKKYNRFENQGGSEGEI